MVPALVPQLAKADIEVVIESGAGFAAGFLDEEYSAKGAKVLSGRAEVFQQADLIAQVRALGANPEAGKADLELIRDGQAIVGMCEPLTEHDSTKAIANKGGVLFSMEMMPRAWTCCRRWPRSRDTRRFSWPLTSSPRCSR
jgi:NAD(P) transhydrogenase subunit alpha